MLPFLLESKEEEENMMIYIQTENFLFTSSMDKSSDISDILLILFFGGCILGGRVIRRISPGIRR
jgi:hypothetical protein